MESLFGWKCRLGAAAIAMAVAVAVVAEAIRGVPGLVLSLGLISPGEYTLPDLVNMLPDTGGAVSGEDEVLAQHIAGWTRQLAL
ncbi:hypothetical protein E2C01_085262 [Portunus trituberculatus]|uniref:Uncharacterized protein n=1 Tax=Portunus trituberculatus TaxID=210409 RepID=A0A5B7J6C8_PORTR|nr:hypothetical protein [Portunus trituberculatus]